MAQRTPPTDDELAWLQLWYASRCDGSWEHEFGVTVETCDNPGWLVTIDLNKEPPDRAVARVLLVTGDPPRSENGNVGGTDWMTCEVKGVAFQGAGDPTKLSAIIRCFREMVAGPV